MIAVSIPAMAKSLGQNPLRLNLVIATYLLSLAVFIPVSGWIADRLGARIVFCSAIAIFTTGSALVRAGAEPADAVGDAGHPGVWRRDDDAGRAADPIAQLSALRTLVSAMNWMTIPAMIGPTVGPIVGGFLTS